MTIPGLDYGYINPALLGNDHDRFDACDQRFDPYAGRYPDQLAFVDKSHPTNQMNQLCSGKLATNQHSVSHPITNQYGTNQHGTNQLGASQHGSNPHGSNPHSNLTTAASQLRPNGKSSFKLKSSDLRRLLKRRYSENVIGNLPVNDKMTNHSPTMPNLSKDLRTIRVLLFEFFGCFMGALCQFFFSYDFPVVFG